MYMDAIYRLSSIGSCVLFVYRKILILGHNIITHVRNSLLYSRAKGRHLLEKEIFAGTHFIGQWNHLYDYTAENIQRILAMSQPRVL